MTQGPTNMPQDAINATKREEEENATNQRKRLTTSDSRIFKGISSLVLGAIFIAIIGSDLGLFWGLMIGGLAVYFGNMFLNKKKVEGEKAFDFWILPELVRGMGILLISIYALNSGIVQWSAEKVTYGDKCLKNGKCPETNTPTPGTREVTDEIFVGRANGQDYTLSTVRWSVFEWPDGGYCMRVPGDTYGVIADSDDTNDRFALLSKIPGKTVNVYTLAPGQSIGGYTCPQT